MLKVLKNYDCEERQLWGPFGECAVFFLLLKVYYYTFIETRNQLESVLMNCCWKKSHFTYVQLLLPVEWGIFVLPFFGIDSEVVLCLLFRVFFWTASASAAVPPKSIWHHQCPTECRESHGMILVKVTYFFSLSKVFYVSLLLELTLKIGINTLCSSLKNWCLFWNLVQLIILRKIKYGVWW